MWADVLLSLETTHLLRLALWGGGSVLAGSLLLAWLRWRAVTSPLLTHFAIQTAAWGAVDLAICAWARRGLALRDFEGQTALVNFLWLNVGLDAGYVGVGLTLALAAWRLGQRLGAVGAGVGIIVQGLALALLDLRLIAEIAAARAA
ncbi:MAG TPA: hypothetical protein PKE51_00835 [Gemmatimonadaceae bacterium]|nr:hypothetical protein [Gemmatimonadaceae bacterium]